MPSIRFYAPPGVNSVTLTEGPTLPVRSGYITADSKFAVELLKAGFTPVTDDLLPKVSKVFTGTGGVFEGTGTTIPTSVAGPGDYTTKLQFMGNVRDDLGLVDMVNHRIYVPHGYKECRITYNLAWSAHATGWRGCRTKNGSGGNYGNTRMNSVGVATSTNNNNVTPWIGIVESGGVSPDTINAGDYFEFWPAQNSGGNLVCGADLASSFVQLEVR